MTAAAKPPTVLLLEPMYHRVTASNDVSRRVALDPVGRQRGVA